MQVTKTMAACAVGMAVLASSVGAADRLPAFKGDVAQTSVSGLSSGAFMAVQFQVAFSASVKGAGIVAGGPYYCAAGNVLNAGICMGQVPFFPPTPSLMVAAAQGFEAAGQIDPLANLKTSRVYVFSGTKDQVVKQQAVDATVGFYKQAGVAAENLKYVNTLPAGHAVITPAFGNDCAANAAPYISQCSIKGKGYDQAGDILAHIYGKLNAPASASKLGGKIVAFNQREFASTGTGMAEEAYLYVPKSCAQGKTCRVHVAIHGCKQSAAEVGDDFYKDTGYNRWADTNELLVLYPQVNPSTIPANPQGCWDWFGYTGPTYASKFGPQMVAIKAMVDRLTGAVLQ